MSSEGLVYVVLIAIAVVTGVGVLVERAFQPAPCASVVLTSPNGAVQRLTAPDVRRADQGWELHGEVELRAQGKQGSIGEGDDADSHLWVSDDAVQFVYFAEHLCKES